MSNELNRTLLLKEENIKIKKVPCIPADRVGGDDHFYFLENIKIRVKKTHRNVALMCFIIGCIQCKTSNQFEHLGGRQLRHS